MRLGLLESVTQLNSHALSMTLALALRLKQILQEVERRIE